MKTKQASAIIALRIDKKKTWGQLKGCVFVLFAVDTLYSEFKYRIKFKYIIHRHRREPSLPFFSRQLGECQCDVALCRTPRCFLQETEQLWNFWRKIFGTEEVFVLTIVCILWTRVSEIHALLNSDRCVRRYKAPIEAFFRILTSKAQNRKYLHWTQITLSMLWKDSCHFDRVNRRLPTIAHWKPWVHAGTTLRNSLGLRKWDPNEASKETTKRIAMRLVTNCSGKFRPKGIAADRSRRRHQQERPPLQSGLLQSVYVWEGVRLSNTHVKQQDAYVMALPLGLFGLGVMFRIRTSSVSVIFHIKIPTSLRNSRVFACHLHFVLLFLRDS